MESLNRKRRHTRAGRPWALIEGLEPRVMLSYTFTSLASFKGPVTGNHPQGLVMDASGNLFGVTASGGAHGYGAVFEIPAQNAGITPALAATPPTPTLITLASFTGANGIAPRGNLVLDANGNLYGTTVGGGAFNKGTIFEVAAGTASTITTLASFNGTNGSYPFAGLVVDADGNLFGTTLGAGTAGYKSTVFELASGSSAITVLATFKSSDRPMGTLAIDPSGTLFGTTSAGGTHGNGSIFRIAGSAHTFTTLFSFSGTNGSRPNGTLLLDAQGNLFGLTASGGAVNDGTLFTLPASSSTITTLATFKGTNGNRPIGNLLMDAGGNLFGVTATGGSKSVGTVFERAAGTSNTITTLFTFSGRATGFNPSGPLVMDALGNFWGTTYSGGTNGSGTVFQLHDDSVVFAPPPAPAGPLVTSAAATLQLVMTQQPAQVKSGKAFVLVIQIQDAQGHVVASNAKLTLSLASGPKGGKLSGSLKLSFVKGVAKVSNLALHGKGVYTIGVASGSLTTATGAIEVS